MFQHPSEQDFERYRNRELSPADILTLDDHLRNCAKCQLAAREDRETQKLSEQIIGELQTEPDSQNDHLLYQEMADYVDNTLSDVDREIADGHLEYCHNCKLEVEDLLRTRAHLSLLPEKRHSPQVVPNLWQRLTPLWHWPSIRIAAPAAAAIVLVALIAWAVVSYSRKRAEEARIQRDQQEKVVAASSPAPSLEPVTTDNSSPAQESNTGQVVELIDGDNRVALNSDDKLSGLEAAPAQTQNEVIAALKSGRVGSPSSIAELKGRSGRLMGAGTSDYGLLNPVATAVESRTPIFRWRAIDGAESYVVTIYGSDAKKIAASEVLTGTKWRLNRPLERGRIYTWQVRATRKGEEVLMPPPAAAEAKFRILDTTKAEELAQIRQREPRSHLVLGIAYANAGLLDDSARELRKLVAANPKSSVAKSLLRSVEAQKRSNQP